MANLCFTDIKIVDSEDNLELIEKNILDATSSNPLGSDFGNDWLGNLLLHIGVPEDEVVHGNMRCRGIISCVDWCEKAGNKWINVFTETAWRPNVECVKKFAEHYSGTCKITYAGDEGWNGLFWTNDPDMLGKVLVDFEIGDSSVLPKWARELTSGEPMDILECVDVMDTLLGEFDGNGFDDIALKACEAIEYPNYLSIHRYEFVPIGEET